MKKIILLIPLTLLFLTGCSLSQNKNNNTLNQDKSSDATKPQDNSRNNLNQDKNTNDAKSIKDVPVISHEIKSHKDPVTKYSTVFYTVDGQVQNNTKEDIGTILVTAYEYTNNGETVATYNEFTSGNGHLVPRGADSFSVRLGNTEPSKYKLYTTWMPLYPFQEVVPEYALGEKFLLNDLEITVNSINKNLETSAQPYAAGINFVVVNATIQNNSNNDIDIGGSMNFFLDDGLYKYNDRRDTTETFQHLTIGKESSLKKGGKITGNLVFQVPQDKLNNLTLNIQTFFNNRERVKVKLN